MDKISSILHDIEKITQNPHEIINKYLKDEGKKAIGCFLEYCPEELVYAADMLPVGLWGGDVELSLVKKYIPSFFCAPVQQTFELAMSGKYDYLSGVIVPMLCDTMKTAGQNWKVAIPEIEFIPLVYPQNRKIEAGIDFLLSEYKEVKNKLEKICNSCITEEALIRSINIYNEYRKVMREFTNIAQKHLNIITPKIRHSIFEASNYMDKKIYTNIINTLVNELKKIPEASCSGKKVILTGILLNSKGVLEALEENKLTVVSDDLAQETRQIRTDVPKDGVSAMGRLTNRWRDMECCSLLLDPDKKRSDMLADSAKKSADGVIVCMTSFCDPEEYDYPILKKNFEEKSIPHVYIEINDQSSVEQVRTRVQAFAEMID